MARRSGDMPDLFEYAKQRTAKKPRETPETLETLETLETPETLETLETLAVEGESANTPPQSSLNKPGGRNKPLTVARLVKMSATAVEQAVGNVWITGEVASLSRAASGHLYFSLRDDGAEVRAVMWRSDATRLRFRIDNGQELLCRVKPGIYQKGGSFQLYVQHAEPAGAGAEAIALEQLRRKLAAEGLFDASRKRALPVLPRRIGVVTSRSGAAVRDIIRAVERRFPVPILLAPATVQGGGAPASIVQALSALSMCSVDVAIVGRGGGSASDLSAFNDEAVVRAVAAFPFPIVSAVGHEVDSSLCDLAADVRAATPTMAGEMVVPVLADLEDLLGKELRRLHREMRVRLRNSKHDVDGATLSMTRAVERVIDVRRRTLADLQERLAHSHPRAQMLEHKAVIRRLGDRANVAMTKRLQSERAHLEQLSSRLSCVPRRVDTLRHELSALVGKLDALSPLRVLERGYSITTDAEGRVLRRAVDVASGEQIAVRLSQGHLRCTVNDTSENDS